MVDMYENYHTIFIKCSEFITKKEANQTVSLF